MANIHLVATVERKNQFMVVPIIPGNFKRGFQALVHCRIGAQDRDERKGKQIQLDHSLTVLA